MNPAEPKAEGAVILWRSEVPVGWGYRQYATGSRGWVTAGPWDEYNADLLVEARPPKPKTVTVELLEATARAYARHDWHHNSTHYDDVSWACARALES